MFEDMRVKRKISAELRRVMKTGAIHWTNTSSVEHRRIAAIDQRPKTLTRATFLLRCERDELLEIVRAKTPRD